MARGSEERRMRRSAWLGIECPHEHQRATSKWKAALSWLCK